MNTETRWLPMIVDEDYEVRLGPAVKGLKDAMDWNQLEFDGPGGVTTERLVWREQKHGVLPGNPAPWEAMPSTGLRYEILPVQVEVTP